MIRPGRLLLVLPVLWFPSVVPAKVVISEFRLRGPSGGNDEFIEIYNTGPESVDVSGWQLWGSNASGTVSARITFPSGLEMAPNTHLLLVNTASGGYSGGVPGDLFYSTGIADNGGLALKDASGLIVDQVGLSSGSAYQEGTILPAFSSINKNQSYERRQATCGPDQDTDDNLADFEYRDGFSNPENSQSCRRTCAGAPCISPPAPTCLDEQTLQTATGASCNSGFCEYPLSSQVCTFGCEATPAPAHCASDPCEDVLCDTPPNDQCWEAPGVCQGGTCVYSQRPEDTPCDDGDLCSDSDACTAEGACLGTTFRVCELPDPECRENDTVSRTYLTSACQPSSGLCIYTWQDSLCLFGCDPTTGWCQDDPCAGVVCDTPPASQCYQAPGICVGGICQYAPLGTDTLCNDGDPCTDDDHCNGEGGCIGSPRVCNAPPQDAQCYRVPGTCVDGTCLYDMQQVGTPCDDGDLCSDNDQCGPDGLCQGMPRICEKPAPACLDPSTARIGLSASCDPADGTCRVVFREVPCGPGGCQQETGLCSPHPLISQFRTRGPNGGNDEFVEIHNPSDETMDLSDWKLNASNQSGLTGTRFSFPPGTVLPPRTFLLLANSASNGYSEAVSPDFTYSTGISDTGGLALLDAEGRVVDAVGMDPGSAYLEGGPLPPTTQNQRQAWVRKTLHCGPDQDLDDNAEDFLLVTGDLVTPHNARSCRLPCAGAPCIVRPEDRCLDATTRVFHQEGICQNDVCDYPELLEPCPFGCQDGLCLPDPCEGVVCDTPPNPYCFLHTGSCSEGVCSYPPVEVGTECDDGDPCTTGDQCNEVAICKGEAQECPPLDPQCLDLSTSRAFTDGQCSRSTGECTYLHVDTFCPFGCDAASGRCLGDPCAGVLCNDPPSICHQAQGVCVNGECTYALRAAGAPCDDSDPCTVEDACDDSGQCAGNPMTCGDPGNPCLETEGECVEGECHHDFRDPGTSCDDDDPCTTDDQCDGTGVCIGTPVPGCGEADPGTPDTGSEDTGVTDPGAGQDIISPPDPGSPGEEGLPGDLPVQPDAIQDQSPVGDSGTIPDAIVTDQGSSQSRSGGCSSQSRTPTPGWALWVLLCGLALRFRRRPSS